MADGRVMRIRLVVAAVAVAAAHVIAAPLRLDQPVRGWTILSDSEPDAMAVIAAARGYGINHLQLSHQITVREAMTELPAIAREVREYPVKPPIGQWNWAADADAAMRYHRAVPSR